MDPFTLGAIVQGGASLLNTGSQLFTNKKNRQNALDDWNRVNAYNSPAQQMARFKEAGLNPNLIYKQTNEAPPVRSTDYVAPKLDADVTDVIGKYADYKQKQVQTELQSQAIQNAREDLKTKQLTNEGLAIRNKILADSQVEQTDAYAIKNRVANASYDRLIAGANLDRQSLSQRNITNPLQVKTMEQQFRALSTNNDFQKLNLMQKYEIGEITKNNLKEIGEGIKTQNGLKSFELKMRQSLDNLNIGSGLAQDIIKILVSKIF